MGCKECELHVEAKNPAIRGVKGEFSNDIMIITDSPSRSDDEQGILHTGYVSKWLKREMIAIGINMDEICYVTTAVKCHHTEKPLTHQFKECYEVLKREIEKYKPRYILILGSYGLHALKGTTNMKKSRGKSFKYGDAICMATYHPIVAMKNPSDLEVWRSDLFYFSRIVQNDWVEPTDFSWKWVNTTKVANELMIKLRDHRERSFDIETTGLDYRKDGVDITMVGIGFPDGSNYIIHRHSKWFELMSGILNNVTGKVNVAHNAMFDVPFLRYRGWKNAHCDFDTFLASSVINVNLPHDLKYLAKVHCGAMDYAIDMTGATEHDENTVAEYCAWDCYWTMKLYYKMKELLLEDKALARVFKYIMMPASRTISGIKERGVYVDYERLLSVEHTYEDRLSEMDNSLKEECGDDINFNSPKQLADLLFGRFKLKPVKKTKSGYSTDKETLKKLADVHHVPKMILDFRTVDKALNTFVRAWKEKVEYEIDRDRESRLYPSYNLGRESNSNGDDRGTRTGRLSSFDPNLQQATRDTNVRSLISAPEGKVFVEADMSQIELRIAAFEAQEKTMLDIYRSGGDIHTTTACEVSGIDITKLDDKKEVKRLRTAAKAVNFGYLFGMWWKAFKDYAYMSYGVVFTDDESMQSRERFFNKYPKLVKWHDKQRTYVRKYKCVRTKVGRIRHLPDIDSYDKDLSGKAERQAINTPVQSFASDITLLVMILADAQVPKDKAFMVGQVHDATLWECVDGYQKTLAAQLRNIAEVQVPEYLRDYFGVDLNVPLVIDVSCGTGWGNGEEIPRAATE